MKVLLMAGEPSGDRYAAGIARALRELAPSVELRGMGGTHLREAGVDIVVDSGPLAVVGLTEVLGSLRPLLAARSRLREVVRAWRPDVLVPVDYPDFNLRLARWARARGVPVAYFVSPQVWAWRPGRVPAIGRAVSRMLVLFPFEVETYRRHGIPVEHVGHPLIDLAEPPMPTEEARSSLGLPRDAPVVALLPGSRAKEIRHVWPVLAEAARRLAADRSDLRFVVPLAAGAARAILDSSPATRDLPLAVAERDMPRALAAADAAAVASGTATLETALAGVPLVVGYRVSRATMALSRWLADREFLARGLFSLPNLVLGRPAVRELYQERFTPKAVATELERLLGDDAHRGSVTESLAQLRNALGGPGALARTARAVLEVAGQGVPKEG